jgi:hypothetical protein
MTRNSHLASQHCRTSTSTFLKYASCNLDASKVKICLLKLTPSFPPTAYAHPRELCRPPTASSSITIFFLNW